VLTSDLFNRLLEPYDALTTMTTLSWLQKEGAFFDKIIKTSAVGKKHNKFNGAVDSFLVLDNDPEVIELALIKDVDLGDPTPPDIIGTIEQAVEERLAGCVIRHPSAIYIGKGC